MMLAAVLAAPGIASAQLPDAGGLRPDQSPEEMVDAALEKIRTGDLEQARVLILNVKKLKPTLDKLNLAEGLWLIEARQVPDAIQRLTAYNKSPEGLNDWRGFAAIGEIHKNSRMYRMAIRPLTEAKKFAPVDERGEPIRAQVTMNLALCYLGLDRKEDALAAAQEAEALASSDPDILLGAARVAMGANDEAFAEQKARRALNLLWAKIRNDPFDQDAHSTLQSSYRLLGRMKERELLPDPAEGQPFFALATLARESAEVDRRVSLLLAREFALQAIEREPGKYEWRVFVARLEMELGGLQEAKNRVDELLREAPENEEALALRALIQAELAKPRER
jgi:tetratricopeptide (TPR) repeat protein